MPELQVGDVVFDKVHNRSYTIVRVDGNFMYSKTLGWMNWNGEIHPHIKSVHRPTPAGLVQVWPEVKDA